MQLTSDSDPDSPRASRLRARLAIGTVTGMVVAAAVAMIAYRSPTPESRPPEDAAVEMGQDLSDDVMRPSEQIDRHRTVSEDDRTGPTTVEGSSPATVSGPVVDPSPSADTGVRSSVPPDSSPGDASPPAAPSKSPSVSPERPSAGPANAGDPGGPAGPVGPDGTGAHDDRPDDAVTPATLPRPFYLPGPGSAPVLGPLQLRDDSDRPPSAVEVDGPDDDEPKPRVQHQPEPPDRDEDGCPQLNLYPIGGFTEDAPEHFAELSPRFRALAASEWTKPELVCGHAMEPWRDLVIQRLVADGQPDGALITAADGSSIVMRVSEIEWASYKFRYGGGPIGPNLLGYPVARTFWSGLTIVQTTAGGLIFDHPEAMGLPLIGGAWDLWVANGGPDGFMGVPTGRPESATGPTGADIWVAGLPSSGARQEFTNGWLFLPGVLTDVEAAAQPMDRYQWYDASELEPPPTEPIDYRGHIMQISGISYYVDADGIRHWIRSTSDWSCAHWDLKATEYEVHGFELDQYPLGDEFVCSAYK